MVIKKKNIILMLVLVAFIVGLGFGLRDASKNNEVMSTAESNTDEQFSNDLLPGEAMAVSGKNDVTYKFRNDRELIRSKACEILQKIINDEASSEEAKKDAEERILKLADDINKEAQIESLLIAKGLNEPVVFISDNSVSVTIASKKLSNDEIAKINDIVYEISGNNNVKIVEVN